jgi:hypothetical protein
MIELHGVILEWNTGQARAGSVSPFHPKMISVAIGNRLFRYLE